MKKSFLFAILAIFLAGAGFGGISMAETTDTGSETSTESTTCTANCVAKIGEIQYATLAEAIEAAKEDNTITLLENITLDKNVIISKKINIDLGGKNIEGNGNRFAFINGANSEIGNGTIINTTRPAIQIQGGANVTIKNGDFTSTNGSALAVTDNSKLTIDNANIIAQEVAVLATTNSTVTIKNGTYTTRDNFVVGTNGTPGQGGNTITIDGGTFNGNIQSAGYIACGIYAPNDDTITVNGGTFNITNGVGVAIRAGKVNIGENAIFKYTAGNISEGYVGDSKVKLPAGNKIVIDLRAGYPGLNDNTFKVESKKNNNDTFTNQLYVIEDTEPSFSSKDVDNAEITKKSGEYKVEIQGGTFSKDVTENTADDKCSIKNSEGKYEVKVCPESVKFDMSSKKNITIPVVLNENGDGLLLNETIAVLNKDGKTEGPLYTALTAESTTQEDLDNAAKVVEVEGQKLLFFKQLDDQGYYKIGVFNENLESVGPFSDRTKFIGGTTYNSENPTITFDSESGIEDPFTVSSWDIKTYNEIQKDSKTVGYTLYVEKNGNNGWFYAPRMYKITFDVNEGVGTYEAQKVALTEGKATNPGIPTKEGSGFKFWSLSNDEESATEYDFNTVVTGDITLYAMYGDDAFTITWKNGNDIINTGVFASGAMPAYVGDTPSKDADSTCNTYEFKEWNPSVTAVTGETTYTATFTCTSPKSSKSSGGSGGGGSSKTSTTNGTKAETGSQNNIKNDDIIKTNGDENGVDNNESTDSQTALDDGFTQEFHDAYDFAFKNGITTMPSIAEADMNGTLTRIAMAKMLSQYAINVLGKTPDTGKNISFPDVSPELDAQYNSGVTLAYQLGIMGINIDEFRPFDEVTRAEFVTALSRMLFGLADGENLYYETHMQKLLEEKIITVADPDMKELRGYVMIMLMRSAKK